MTDDSIPFTSMTDAQAVVWARQIERCVHRDPARYLTQEITPFATAADLMGGPPPARWRLGARARWRDKLFERVLRELLRQRSFAKSLTEAVS